MTTPYGQGAPSSPSFIEVTVVAVWVQPAEGLRFLNKQAGGELGISEITVQARRGKVMQKMKADSLADLVKMAAKLPIESSAKA